VAAAAAIFGGGLVAGQSTGGGDDEKTPPPITTTEQTQTRDGSVSSVAPDAAVSSGSAASSSSGMMAIYPGEPMCPANLGSVVNGSTIDLSAAGLTPALPGEGFTLRNLNLQAMGPCDGSGTATPMLDTQWHHDATGIDAWIHQEANDKPVASVIRGTSATFFSDGYVFQVNVSGGAVAYAMDDSREGGSTSPASPGIPRDDPNAAAVLQTVIASLAPSLPDACFAHQQNAGWDALGTLGIGDPRPAIPDGWTEDNVSAITYAPAEQECGRPPLTDGGSFSASYTQSASDGSWAGALVISANALPPNADSAPGTISDYGVNWSNGSYSFGVYAKAAEPIARDQLTAIATALDPGFDVAALTEEPSGGDGIEPMPMPATDFAASPPVAAR
jgi:hypothetical protein